MKYYYNKTTGQILVKMLASGISMRSDPYIITDQVIADWDLDQYQINIITKQLEKISP